MADRLTKMKFASQGQVVEVEQVPEEGEKFLQELLGAQNQPGVSKSSKNGVFYKS